MLLQPGGQVDGLSDDQELSPGPPPGSCHDLSGIDADANLRKCSGFHGGTHLGFYRQSSSGGPLGVLLVDGR